MRLNFLGSTQTSVWLERLLRGLQKRWVVFTALFMLGALSLILRTRALDAGFWIDEGISVGIASFSWDQIPKALRLDGSPPLYYMLLHYWMRLFGQSEEYVHFLSVIPAVLSIPAAFWAGKTLFNRRCAWFAALLVATHPFLTYYAQEVRMYSLVVLLSFLVLGSYGEVFLHKNRRVIPVAVLTFTLLLYTHNWSFFFFFGCGCTVLLSVVWDLWVRHKGESWRRRGWLTMRSFWHVGQWPLSLRFGVLLAGVVGLLYSPWIPTMIFQARNTGAPWAAHPGVTDFFHGWTRLLGGSAGAPFAILLLCVGCYCAITKSKTFPQASESARKTLSPTTVLIVVAVSGIFLGWLIAQATGLWVERYLIVFLPVVILLLANALASLGHFGVLALCLLFVIWFNPLTKDLNSKSNAKQIAQAVQYRPINPGDAVISTQPEQVPVLRYYLGGKLQYYSSIGLMNEPRIMDWRQSLHRLENVRPRAEVARLVRNSQPGRLILLVQPIIRTARWNAPWTALVRTRAIQWAHALDDHPRLRRIEALPEFGYGPLPRGVRVVIYRVRARSRVTTRFL